MSTIQDAERCITNLSGAIALSLPTNGPNPFAKDVERLGRRIAMDNSVEFGSEEFDALPLETPLSDTAESMFAEVRRTKKVISHIVQDGRRARTHAPL